MERIFFPGCRVKKNFPKASAKLASYMEEKHGLTADGCCRVNFEKLGRDGTAVLICNNCSAELKSRGASEGREFVFELIDADPDFPFPDQSGRPYVLLDCAHGYCGRDMGKTVRSLLKKMHIDFRELPPDSKVPDGLTQAEHAAFVRKAMEAVPEEDIITYCGICNLYVNKSGKRSHYLAELLFDTETGGSLTT